MSREIATLLDDRPQAERDEAKGFQGKVDGRDALLRRALQNAEVAQRRQHRPGRLDRHGAGPLLPGILAFDSDPIGQVFRANLSIPRPSDLPEFLGDVAVQDGLRPGRQPIIKKPNDLNGRVVLLDFSTEFPCIRWAACDEPWQECPLIRVLGSRSCRLLQHLGNETRRGHPGRLCRPMADELPHIPEQSAAFLDAGRDLGGIHLSGRCQPASKREFYRRRKGKTATWL